MKIKLANKAGFCFGVKRAVNIVNKLASNSTENIYTYGPLIHNKQVIEKLKEKNVATVEDLSNINPKEDILIIRSHGVPQHVYEFLKSKNIKYVDCTCPYVSNIHKIVNEYYNKKYQIFIVGDYKHPEVIGINGWCNNTAYIIENEKTVDKLPIYDKICLVAQTTITKKLWENILSAVISKYKDFADVKIFNTICNATVERQNSAAELAKLVDTMFVIGGFDSSNTKKLYQVCKEYCENTYQIETTSDLEPKMFKNAENIGITAGASTPDWIIKEVISAMHDMEKENQLTMMEEYEKSFKSITVGDVVKGKVISVSDDEVAVDIGYKADGIIKKEDLTWDMNLKPIDIVKPKDEIEVKILKINDGEGNVLLSKKAVDSEKNFYKIEYAYNEKLPVDGIVVSVVKGGGIVEVYGIKTFMPASQFDITYTSDLSKFLKNKITVKIIEFDKEKKKIVVSRKEYLKDENTRKEKELWNSIEEGQKLIGEVKRLSDFGVFVDIGGVDGLIHISELSWNRIKHPSEIVKPGDKVEVIVLKLDRENKKISLGLKQTMPEPWESVKSKYNIGDIIKVKIARFADFGAFAEIEPGVDGLIHISQISDKRINKPSDVLKIGETIKAKIIDIKPEDKKISLSLKDVENN